MEFRKFGNKYILRLDRGEEIVSTLKKFCIKQKIKLGTIKGLGAADKVSIGLFKTKEKKYVEQEFNGDYEISPLYGNISTMKGEVYLHIHINIADPKQNSYGGHLSRAVVSATFEAVIDAVDGSVDRAFSEEIGLNLYKF